MARAAKRITTRVKQTKTRKSRAVIKSLSDKYYGPEPIDISVKGFTDALNWYNYMYEQDEVRDWLLDYMKNANYSRPDIAAVRRLPKHKITKTSCTIARILSNGNNLEQPVIDRFKRSISEYIEQGSKIKSQEVVDELDSKPVPTIQERMRAKNEMIFAEAEAEVVDQRGSMYAFLQRIEASVPAATFMLSKYQTILDEVMLDEPDVIENFGGKAKIRDERKFWQTVVDDLERYAGNKKVTKVRKTRTKKIKSAVDIVKSLKFQKEDSQLKIVSINPTDIVGAQRLWTFNTKYRILTQYDAIGPAGLSVKGASITGFDQEKSTGKRLRKPEQTIAALLAAGKISQRKFMSELKTTDIKPNGRINTSTILLKVAK